MEPNIAFKIGPRLERRHMIRGLIVARRPHPRHLKMDVPSMPPTAWILTKNPRAAIATRIFAAAASVRKAAPLLVFVSS